jgi:DNA-binding transcriptional LysR family regulator
MRAGRGRQLRYLEAIAEEGQIGRAAAKLKLGRAALSDAIGQLESEVGVPLVDRGPRGVALTAAGEAFLERGRGALGLEDEAAHAAQSLARAGRGVLTIGFIGPPPTVSSPGLFERFSEENGEAQLSFQDLTFPSGSTAGWLTGVDAAICQSPAPEATVSIQPLRREARAVVLRRDHPFADAKELAVGDVLDEPFVSYHRDVQDQWAGFHSLDDARGGPPARMTDDRVLTSLQMLAVMSASPAITTVPLLDARLAAAVMPNIAAIPLRAAAPAEVSLVWRRDNRNPLLATLTGLALGTITDGDGV